MYGDPPGYETRVMMHGHAWGVAASSSSTSLRRLAAGASRKECDTLAPAPQ